MSNERAIEILLVEDNEGDIFLTQKAFEKGKIRNHIEVVTDGEMAINYLKRSTTDDTVRRPDIILLDINLPRKDGKQVLSEIKRDDNLRSIPVVILTSSQAEQDIVKTYDLQASSYIVKPINLAKFHEIVTAIEDFWFSVVVLPSSR